MSYDKYSVVPKDLGTTVTFCTHGFTTQVVVLHKVLLQYVQRTSIHALQKQVGCFNHQVVTMVADKLETQWL